jgi:hypothetical protein
MHTCNLGIVQWLNGSTIHKLREHKYAYFGVLAALAADEVNIGW